MEIFYNTKNNKKVTVELISGRTAVVSSPATFIDEVIDDREYKLISYEGNVDFKIDQILNFNIGGLNSKFDIKQIKKNTQRGKYYLHSSIRNINSYFILPLLGYKDRWFGWYNFLLNTYLTEDFKEIILVVRFFPGKFYIEFEEKLKSHPKYLGFIDPSTWSIGYRFYIGDLDEDIKYFIEGKYSKISKNSKDKIISFFLDKELKDTLIEVLNKSNKRKSDLENSLQTKIPSEIDLLSKPIIENEIWKNQ